MKENSIRRAMREGRAALGTGLKEFASRPRAAKIDWSSNAVSMNW